MPRYFLIIFFLVSAKLVSAQGSIGKWGKLTDDEINLKNVSFEEDADAVILSEEGKITTNGQFSITNVHRKIKVLTEQGKELANQHILLYSSWEKVRNLKAQTINIVNGKKVITEVRPSEIYTEKINDKWNRVKFFLPDVQAGSVLEIKYGKLSENPYTLDGWTFQHDLPTLLSSVSLVVENNYMQFQVFYNGPRLQNKYVGRRTSNWELTNMPSLKEESYIGNYKDYAESLEFEFANRINTWEHFITDIYLDNEIYQAYMNRPLFYDNILEDHITGIGEEKLKNTFNHIRNYVNWNGYYSYGFNEWARTVYKNKSGNVAEINLLLVGLLRRAGFEAYPLLISTRSNGKITKNIPFFDQFNYLLAYVNLDGKEFFLDASNKDLPYNMTNAICLNGEGLLIKDGPPEWRKIKEGIPSMQVISAHYIFSNKNQLTVESDIALRGKYAYEARKKGPKKYLDGMRSVYSITDVKIDDQPEKEIRIHCNLMPDSHDLSSRIYLNPIPLTSQRDNPFKLEYRQYPVEYPQKFTEYYSIIIDVPEGYVVESMPEPKAISMLQNKIGFVYSCSQAGDKLNIQAKFDVKTNLVDQTEYEKLKAVYNEMISAFQSPVVFIKKS